MNRIAFVIITVLFCKSVPAESQDKYISSDIVPLAGKEGIRWQSKAGDFLFKPYILVQSRIQGQYYDDEGFDLFEQDNIANSGFSIPSAIIGISGKAFDKLTYNLALNAVSAGAALLNQAWFDVNFSDGFRIRLGKFKTPAHGGFLAQLGQTMFTALPQSLTTPVNIPFSLNSVNPVISTGFDLGMQLHGIIGSKWDYRFGFFNGTGASVNDARITMSDDFKGVPSLLYAGRIAWMPWGPIPFHQGEPDDLSNKRFSLALSTSYNVEANWESSNDLRCGAELALLYRRLYFSAESYLLNMDFVERQRVSSNFLFWGGYAQLGWFINPSHQPVIRFDTFDRNGTGERGLLILPAAGWNWYFSGYNLKIQLMVQQLLKAGHKNEYLANDDDNGMAETCIFIQGQFSL